MNLISITDNEEVYLVESWLKKPENYKWLDFRNGIQSLNAASIKVMTKREIHLLRLFTTDKDGVPVGLVGLSDIHEKFKTASFWIVLGDEKYRGQGLAVRAASQLLTIGFKERGLHAINAWTLVLSLIHI